MISGLPNIEIALKKGILVDNPQHREDYEKILAFSRLKGRPNRPIDSVVFPRAEEEFHRLRPKLPVDFFVPFNRLAEIARVPPIDVEPDLGAIQVWNQTDFVPRLVSTITELLDDRGSARLVPILVWAFLNLEREHLPPPKEWPIIDAITIPGSRTNDRTAEAFRAYLATQGKAYLITSGRAPYYDPENTGIELTESEANAAYLRLLGIPRSHIYSEASSQDTDENAAFLPVAMRQIEQEHQIKMRRILAVTSPFHLARYRLNIETMIEIEGLDILVYAIGSRASRYWAETYFVTDAKSGYSRESTMGVVLNEYLKIAFGLCAENRPQEVKSEARRQ